MRVLITGASGFLGGHLVRLASARAHEVIPTTRGARPPAGWAQLDLRAPDTLTRALDTHRPDVIIHAAAYGVDYRQQDVATALAINATGALALLEAAAEAGVSRFIHVGTSYEYGHSEAPLHEASAFAPLGVYGATKLAGALALEHRARELNVEVLITRVFGMFGPAEGDHKLVPQVVRACLTRAPLALGHGLATRDYMDVRDVADWLLTLALPEHVARWPEDRRLCIGSGRAITIRALAEAVARELDGLELLRFDTRAARPDAQTRVVCDPARLDALAAAISPTLGHLTPLSDTVRDLAATVQERR